MSLSQSSEVPLLAGGFIDLETIRKSTDTVQRRTKIICTLGPACWDAPQLEKLIETGMNVARFNFSHGSHESHGQVLTRLRAASNKLGKNVAVLLDTKGPEIRSGFFAGDVKAIELKKSETLVLTSDYHFKGNNRKLACSYPKLAESVRPGQTILVADGSLVLTVLSVDDAAGEVTTRIENDAKIGERKNMNLPGVVVDLPTFTESDIKDIVEFGVKHQVDFIAASFVRKESDIQNLRELLGRHQAQQIKVIAKIENQEGLQNYESILAATDGIMVARGDLGMEIPPQKVFLAQKHMIRLANIAGKFVIVATQMLESMLTNPRPTRAECSDVANAVMDGTDCVMLSGETANSPYFENAVRVMAKICCEAEGCRNYKALFAAVRRSTILKYKTLSMPESLASSAVKTCVDTAATILVVMSETGTTARLIAKYRPGVAILCLTKSGIVARQTSAVLNGVHAYVVDDLSDPSIVQETGKMAVQAGIAKFGDLMVVVSGTLHGPGSNNQVRVEAITSAEITASGGRMPKLQSFVNASALDMAERTV